MRTLWGLISPCTISQSNFSNYTSYLVMMILHLLAECMSVMAVPISTQSLSRSLTPISLPTEELAKLYKSLKCVFWKTRTGQGTSSSREISQEIPCSSAMFECCWTNGWRSTVISLIRVRKICSSVFSYLLSLWIRFNAKLVCRSWGASLTMDVPPEPISCRLASQVIGRNGMPSAWASAWAVARKEMKSNFAS